MKKIRLFLFGDSICYGQLVSSHKTWAVALAEKLEASSTKHLSFVIQNASVNGNTTRQALERMSYDVTSHRPDYVLVQFGMNDCNYWQSDNGLPRVSEEAFAANLEEIIKKCFACGVKHVFLATNHLSQKDLFQQNRQVSYEESNRKYNKVIRGTYKQICSKGIKNVTLCDNERKWIQILTKDQFIKLERLLLNDGIHLSEAGHDVYINTTVKMIVNKVKQLECL